MVSSQQDIEDIQQMEVTTSQQPNLEKFDAEAEIDGREEDCTD